MAECCGRISEYSLGDLGHNVQSAGVGTRAGVGGGGSLGLGVNEGGECSHSGCTSEEVRGLGVTTSTLGPTVEHTFGVALLLLASLSQTAASAAALALSAVLLAAATSATVRASVLP
mmetsp:Transcript_12128/g.34365  ORF Transcript_12128/g.34365 Transcript_12128/m.34365 type:complete len:117 (-) Transcript_12128:1379-1729(-)